MMVVFSDFGKSAALRRAGDCSVFWLWRGRGATTGSWL